MRGAFGLNICGHIDVTSNLVGIVAGIYLITVVVSGKTKLFGAEPMHNHVQSLQNVLREIHPHGYPQRAPHFAMDSMHNVVGSSKRVSKSNTNVSNISQCFETQCT